jgi:hypothetical protein
MAAPILQTRGFSGLRWSELADNTRGFIIVLFKLYGACG